MAYINVILESTKGMKPLTSEEIEGFFFIKQIKISKSDITAVKRAYRVILTFAEEGIDITSAEPIESTESEGGMSNIHLDSKHLLPIEAISALVEGESIRKRHINDWLESCCVPIDEIDPSVWTSGEEIEESYTEWCKDNKIKAKGRQSLMESLKRRGFKVSVIDPSWETTLRGVYQLKLLDPTT